MPNARPVAVQWLDAAEEIVVNIAGGYITDDFHLFF
jgi:hypothetical protein